MKFSRSTAFFLMTAYNLTLSHERDKAYPTTKPKWEPQLFLNMNIKSGESIHSVLRVKDFAVESATKSSHTPQTRAQA